ncbi:hypothetical protein GCM10022254_40830 [Actinomadura meridiana]|uniref:Uncharacterized protein n=1 Tax=Actinomadura meridiana TaxID=559626 RepID=A0ABP8C745_9ACTN
MSVDVCFWKAGGAPPLGLYEAACEGDLDLFSSSQDVLDFRADIHTRWPEIEDMVDPPEYNPDLEEQEDLSCYVLH